MEPGTEKDRRIAGWLSTELGLVRPEDTSTRPRTKRFEKKKNTTCAKTDHNLKKKERVQKQEKKRRKQNKIPQLGTFRMRAFAQLQGFA